ncbi:site-specific integrase [Deinococcus radiodurans]|nr:site-specific integrase [Deinococcus radiodurans]
MRRQTHNLLNAAYLLGLTDGVVTVNPAARARPVYVERGAARVKAFTPDEAARFYAAARADRWGWPLAFMLATGLRPGEALGLTWADVTMRGSAEGGTLAAVVHIERTRSVSGGRVYEDTPKTERGRRSLTVTGDAARLLLDARAQAEREAGARLRHNGREYQSTGYVFVTRAGTPYRPDNLRRPMARLCQAVGVPVLTPHKLRHTWASVQAAAGVPVEVLSAELGHAAPSFTRDTYRHVYESERASLTYDPLTPAAAPAPEPEPQGRKRVTVRARLAQAEAGSAEGEAGELPPALPQGQSGRGPDV